MSNKFNFDFSKGGKTPAKTFMIGALALISAVYIINPTAGFIEFLPDNLPFLGNLDEFTMGMILLNCLKYFDIDLLSFLSGNKNKDNNIDQPVYEPPRQDK